jgi:hypothetical protein
MERRSVGVWERFIAPPLHGSGTPLLSRLVRRPAARSLDIRRLHVGVPRRKHGGEPGRLLFAPAPLARLLEMPVVAHNLQGALAVDLLLQSPQRFIYRLAFFKLNFGQNYLTSSPRTWGCPGPSWPALPIGQAEQHILWPKVVNQQKQPAKVSCGAMHPMCRGEVTVYTLPIAGLETPQDLHNAPRGVAVSKRVWGAAHLGVCLWVVQ